VQLRFETGLTSSEYVSQQAWRDATLERCPLHPKGNCSFARHGTYERRSPPGTRIPRWYCPQSHCTFSLLADCFAARLPGTLAEVEAVVDQLECAQSWEAAAGRLRVDIELPGALRWMRRRLQAVRAALITLKGLMPECFLPCAPTLAAFREHLAVVSVLIALRAIAAVHLSHLPPPLGFHPPLPERGEHPRGYQHRAGPDPPSVAP
jgi:hypothetical protein